MRSPHYRNGSSEPPGLSDWVELPSWRAKAACLDANPELFFPSGISGEAAEQAEAAKAICAHCTVAAECLYYALDTGQDAGVWGGTTEEERRQIRRKRQSQGTNRT